jgi:Tol biopolymer transport system component
MQRIFIVLASLVVCACAAPAVEPDRLVAASSAEPSSCPVTVPPEPSFVPPSPYPADPPFGQVWYGTSDLWTILDPEGAIWRDLPVGEGRHAIGNKTLWFSEDFSTSPGEDFSGDDRITLTAVDLDGSARTVVQEGGVPSFNRDIKNFLLVGLGLPEPGCWEVTARYRGVELTYVLLVEADGPTSTTAVSTRETLGQTLADASIVFTREEPERGCDVFAIERDASEVALTTTPSSCETAPAVSPDGSTIAVSLDLDDIAVIDVTTLNLRRLTDDPATLDVSPTCSPDGSQIAFSRGPELGPSHLFVMDADGTDMTQLTYGGGSDRNPAWSPDGGRIAFARSGNDGYEVYVTGADGSDVTAVTSVAADSAPSPTWSPDGSQIALDVDGAIHVMSVDGTGLRRLSPRLPKGVFDMRPSWSPDGTEIAFMRYTNEDVADAAEDGDIWVMNADGTNARVVTRGPAIDGWAGWVRALAE